MAATILNLSAVPPIEIGVSWPGFTLTVSDEITGLPFKFKTEANWQAQSAIKYPSSQIRYRVDVTAVSDGVLAFTMSAGVTEKLPRLGKVDWDYLLQTPQGVRVRHDRGVLQIMEAVTIWRP